MRHTNRDTIKDIHIIKERVMKGNNKRILLIKVKGEYYRVHRFNDEWEDIDIRRLARDIIAEVRYGGII